MTLKQAINAVIMFILIGSYEIFGQALVWNSFDYMKNAETLISKFGIEPKSHTVLVANCAFIMKNYIDLNDVPELQSMSQSEIKKTFFAKNFWGEKLERELNIPYSDNEFRQFVAKIQQEVNDFVRYLNMVNSRSSSFELNIFGSMAKARFGVNSSLDILLDSSDQKLLSKLDNGIYSINHPKFRGNIELITSNNEASFLLGPFHPVTVGELSNLAKVYEDILASNNLSAKQNESRFSILFTEQYPKFSLEFNPIEDRVYYLINKLSQLLNIIENSTELFIPSNLENQRKTKQTFSDQLQSLGLKFSDVENDLKLIVEQKDNPRHSKIKSVIKPASYSRLKGTRGKRMLALIGKKLILIEKQSQLLK